MITLLPEPQEGAKRPHHCTEAKQLQYVMESHLLWNLKGQWAILDIACSASTLDKVSTSDVYKLRSWCCVVRSAPEIVFDLQSLGCTENPDFFSPHTEPTANGRWENIRWFLQNVYRSRMAYCPFNCGSSEERIMTRLLHVHDFIVKNFSFSKIKMITVFCRLSTRLSDNLVSCAVLYL